MNFSGMTVNERLFVSGLIKEFDSAKKAKDEERIVEILKKIEVDELSIKRILKDIGL